MHSRIFRTTALATAIAFSSLAFAAGATPAQAKSITSSTKSTNQAQQHSILEELHLTEKQQTTIRETMQQNFQQLRPQMQTVAQKREAFENATPGSAGYQATVNDLAQAEADFARARTLREGALRSKINEVLTPAQRTKLKNLIAEQRARAQQMQQAAQAQHAAGSSSPPASH
ncbi:MAG: Spy/CpxP family protein refolding chaperone [Rhodanobacteraceae bacterium]